MKKILGISAFYHDSAAAICVNGQIVAAAQEERFTRKKHTFEFPSRAVMYCLEETGIHLNELDAISFYDKPLLKFERLLETHYAYSPKGLKSFIKSVPVWVNEKIHIKKRIRDELFLVQEYKKDKAKILFPEHHLSHAASAFYMSPFERSAILTIDGVGEWSTATIGEGVGINITTLRELHFPHSVGLLYSSVTYYLGFKVNSGEYKVMGLAPYGDKESDQTRNFVHLLRNTIADIKEDGSIWLNQEYFKYATGLRMVDDKLWEKTFGISRREPESKIEQGHCNLALAIQTVLEEIVLKMAGEARRITQSDHLCMAGGVALNCVANSRLMNSGLFKKIFVQPASGDAGGALGAALAAHYIYFRQARSNDLPESTTRDIYFGPEYSDLDIERELKRNKAHYQKFEDFGKLVDAVAEDLAQDKVVGWFQGKMEFGPRALGNRSILADARNPRMQSIINRRIKKREEFRPFAPAVLAEDVHEYFDFEGDSPYMLFTAAVVPSLRKKRPQSPRPTGMDEKLQWIKSDIPSVTHIDYSSRIQTVHRDLNPRFWKLIQAFKKRTGCSVLINTSFNMRGEPIVCSPRDACHCFLQSKMDVLVMNNYYLDIESHTTMKLAVKPKTSIELD